MLQVSSLPEEESGEVVLFGGGEGLAPLRLAHLDPGETLPFHIFTHASSGPGEFVLTWRRGRTLRGKARDFVWAYFAVTEAGQVLVYLNSREMEKAAAGEAPALTFLADTLLVFTLHFFSHEEARTPENLAAARRLIAGLDRGLAGAKRVPEAITGLRRHDSGLYSHCLNVSLLALGFGQSLGWDEEERQTLALGALLHDLGMVPWARETYHQTTPLSDRDWEEIKAHPVQGAELLESLDKFPAELLLMVRQHHESPNGSGYPEGLQGEAIHPWARLLRILDSYEAMTSLRPWRPPVSERQAQRLMATAWKSQGGYDPEYLERFVEFCRGKATG